MRIDTRRRMKLKSRHECLPSYRLKQNSTNNRTCRVNLPPVAKQSRTGAAKKCFVTPQPKTRVRKLYDHGKLIHARPIASFQILRMHLSRNEAGTNHGNRAKPKLNRECLTMRPPAWSTLLCSLLDRAPTSMESSQALRGI